METDTAPEKETGTDAPDVAGCPAPTGSAFRPTKKFCCQYYHDGGWWGCMIDAYDFQDAETRAKKLSMKLDGEYVMTIPANVGSIAKILCWLRNLLMR